MATKSASRVRTYQASGAIKNFSFVKFGATKGLVAQCGANERSIGIYNGDADAASGDDVEICLPGGGALLVANETIALGKMLTSVVTTGYGEVADAAGEWVGAVAYEDAVVNDVFGVEVVVGSQAVASDA